LRANFRTVWRFRRRESAQSGVSRAIFAPNDKNTGSKNMSDPFKQPYVAQAPDYFPEATGAGSTAPGSEVAVAPNRPSDTISFFALTFTATALAYWLLLKGSSYETAFTYALGAAALGAGAGLVAVVVGKVAAPLLDWVVRLLPWALGAFVLVAFIEEQMR
jgi:hypothetical protein